MLVRKFNPILNTQAHLVGKGCNTTEVSSTRPIKDTIAQTSTAAFERRGCSGRLSNQRGQFLLADVLGLADRHVAHLRSRPLQQAGAIGEQHVILEAQRDAILEWRNIAKVPAAPSVAHAVADQSPTS